MKVKIAFCCLFSCIVLHLPAQLFVRVFAEDGTKIARGRVLGVKDTALQLRISSGDTVAVPVSKINSIVTKHSAGHTILWGAAIGSPLIGIFAAATAPGASGGAYSGFNSPAFQGLVGALLGAPVGGFYGALVALFKKQDTYVINGDAAKLQQYRSQLVRE